MQIRLRIDVLIVRRTDSCGESSNDNQ